MLGTVAFVHISSAEKQQETDASALDLSLASNTTFSLVPLGHWQRGEDSLDSGQVQPSQGYLQKMKIEAYSVRTLCWKHTGGIRGSIVHSCGVRRESLSPALCIITPSPA